MAIILKAGEYMKIHLNKDYSMSLLILLQWFRKHFSILPYLPVVIKKKVMWNLRSLKGRLRFCELQ